jgi:energy-coupling factor transport system substrate-specific component
MDEARSSDGDTGDTQVQVGEGPLAWKTRDVVVAAALAVPLGIVFYVWLIGWNAAQLVPALAHFAGGLYVLAGIVVGYVLRRPGAALLGEMIAALVEWPLAPYGVIILFLGLLQGLGVEAVFAATRYRNYSLPVMMLAGAVGALAVLFGRFYVAFGYASLAPGEQVLRLVATVAGGAILGGLLGKVLADALARTGVLNNYPIARDRVREV